MIQLQFLNKILNTHDLSLVTLNNIGVEYFSEYEEEFKFIQNHYDKYAKVPDKETFIAKFTDFNFIDVQESDTYLVDALQEDFVYRRALEVFKSVNEEMVNGDSRHGVELLLSKIPDLTAKLNVEAVDILKEGAKRRFDEYCDKGNNTENYYISTGIKELDEIIGGWNKSGDLVAVCGRPGTGKSWWMDLFLANAAKAGKTVALYSGEMSESQVGYRIDTFMSGISNWKISHGYSDVFDDYQKHIEGLQKLEGKFYVCTPKTLGGIATVPKLRAFCERYKVDLLGVDQYSLMDDANKNRARTERYEAISKDLKTLQIELGIPVLVNAQLNRGAVSPDTTEIGTEHIAGSDRIAQDSSIVLAITRPTKSRVCIHLTKVREATTGGKLTYEWQVDKGEFTFVPDDRASNTQEEEQYTERNNTREETEPQRREVRPQRARRQRAEEQTNGNDEAF